VEHEFRHVHQNAQVRNGGTVWRMIDDHFSDQDDFKPFFEADAYLVNLKGNGSWKFIKGAGDGFKHHYDGALYQGSHIQDDGTGTKEKVRELLQEIYEQIPFLEMKREGYDWYVRPPE